MPPPRRRPATPPARRPKVAGLTRRPETQEDAAPETPVTQDEPGTPEEPNGQVRTVRRRDPVPPAPEPQPEPEPEPEPEFEPASGTVEIDDDPQAKAEAEEEETRETEAAEDEAAEREPNYLIPIILVVAALVIAGLGYWFTIKRNDAMAGADNGALVDVGGTQQLVDAAKQGVVNALSYKFDELDKAGTRAKEYLDGEAVDQYDKTMQAIRPDIEKQKLQVVVNPVNVAVVNLTGDQARVLVFADQIGVREDKQPAGGPTQFAMDMRRVDGKWKISRLDFFDGR